MMSIGALHCVNHFALSNRTNIAVVYWISAVHRVLELPKLLVYFIDEQFVEHEIPHNNESQLISMTSSVTLSNGISLS